MKILLVLIFIILACVNNVMAVEGCTDDAIHIGVEFDSRPFLTSKQKLAFKRIYPEFDEAKYQKEWEWKDVDPLGFFSPSENRKRRREVFLFEYSPDLIRPSHGVVSSAQQDFRNLLKAQLKGAEIKLDDKNIKIKSPYTEDYETKFPYCNLFKKLATLGLQWAQAGGRNLYIYNGGIFLGSYKSGRLRIANHNIDKPPVKLNTAPKVMDLPEQKHSMETFEYGLWSNAADGFGARFPNTPERIAASTKRGSGYAYQSTKDFNGGGALYAITVVPIPPKIAKEQPAKFLEESNIAFIKSMGQEPNRAKVGWVKFGDDRQQLNYAVDFIYSGVTFKGRGFWVIDNARAIRVSVAYTEGISNQDSREIISFLDSFVLLLNRVR